MRLRKTVLALAAAGFISTTALAVHYVDHATDPERVTRSRPRMPAPMLPRCGLPCQTSAASCANPARPWST